VVKKSDKISKADIIKINKKFLESLENYRKLLNVLSGDMPLGCLCLPKKVEKILTDNGFLRIYDLINTDFTKIEGLSEVSIRDLTTRIDQFFAMS
jgi:hypothetical protein